MDLKIHHSNVDKRSLMLLIETTEYDRGEPEEVIYDIDLSHWDNAEHARCKRNDQPYEMKVMDFYKHHCTLVIPKVGPEKTPLLIDRSYRHNNSFFIYHNGEVRTLHNDKEKNI